MNTVKCFVYMQDLCIQTTVLKKIANYINTSNTVSMKKRCFSFPPSYGELFSISKITVAKDARILKFLSMPLTSLLLEKEVPEVTLPKEKNNEFILNLT